MVYPSSEGIFDVSEENVSNLKLSRVIRLDSPEATENYAKIAFEEFAVQLPGIRISQQKSESMATNFRFLHVFVLAITFGVSSSQKVFLYRNFLSNEECDHLISRVQGKKSHMAQDNDSPEIETSKIPANFNISLDTNDEITRKIEKRISAWTFLPNENSLPFRVMHFASEDSEQSYSYFDAESAWQVDQPLLATVVLYLSDVNRGGQIIFPLSKNKMLSDCSKNSGVLQPRKGNAIIFFNVHLNAAPDTSSFHSRCPVHEGYMWCATKFIYVQKVATAGLLPESWESADCTDEDESCPRWASIGECQRNPLFMIGSPDYYGTCRKSCNACEQ